MSQIALPLDTASSGDDEGYVVTPANLLIHEQLQNWKEWPNRIALLIGPASSGKTAMACAFKRMSNGRILENADAVSDDALFHAWNEAKEADEALLLVSSKPVSEWGIILPDLQSRLAASQLLEIGPPDEAMMEGILQKYFAARGLSVSQDALAYLAKRMERSYSNIQYLARKLDNLAIVRQKPVNRSIAREVMEQVRSETERPDES